MTLARPETTSIPDSPGAYLFRDPDGRVIYVGKARSLRKRLASYWGKPQHPRTEAMLSQAASVEWIVASTEVDALMLEYNLIKAHRPRFNVRYRDDKSYPYLAITVGERWPRARVLRGPKRKGVRHFGPYGHAYAIRETLDALTRVFPVRTCSNAFFDQRARAGRPCLYYDIGRCAGPCVPSVTGVTEEGYRQLVEAMASFLAGDHRPVLRRLEEEMRRAAEALEFEKAAKLRDQLAAARKALESQEMVLSSGEDLDVVGVEEDDLEAAFQVFFVRRGRVMGRRGWVVDKVEDIDRPRLLASFLRELYMEREEVPPQVLVPAEPEERPVLEQWLAVRRGGPVRIAVPVRGERRRLLQVVTQNAGEAFARHKLRRATDFAARQRALEQLAAVLGLREAPLRIEAYDISNLGPTDKVGSMVVFEDGLPKRSDYRRFEVKGVPGQDDFASMEEVLRRRLARVRAERGGASEGGDGQPEDGRRRFAYPPGLILVDGGRGQLSVAERVLAEFGLDIPAVGLAKRLEEVYVPGQPEPLVIPRGSEALFLLQHVRDEAHRFAVSYHRTKRARRALRSELDDIPGVGEVRKRALIRHFGSLARVRSATVEELASAPGVGPALAGVIHAHLHGGGGARDEAGVRPSERPGRQGPPDPPPSHQESSARPRLRAG
ncbi:MAG TPA: excinuclease ABC subunit UvrC [Actinomycetota bacterium]|nr:excinuclease ABC subunit UvrC [Actinomycetota bacterium]